MSRGATFGRADRDRKRSLAELITQIDAVDGDGAYGQFRHRGSDERDSPGAALRVGTRSSSSLAATTVTSTACSCKPGRAPRLSACRRARACRPAAPRGHDRPRASTTSPDSRRPLRCTRTGIAGVIWEPIVGNMGLVRPSPGVPWPSCGRLTTHHGTLLVYDEVMTGFRLAFPGGGAQELFGQRPDLTILGKIVGGGLPVGAYGGRADLMKKVMPAGPVFQAGTLSGNPLAMAAGLATLRELRERPPYAALESLRPERWGAKLPKLCAGERSRITSRRGRGSMWTLQFLHRDAGGRLRRGEDERCGEVRPVSSGQCSNAACICRAASSRRRSCPRR